MAEAGYPRFPKVVWCARCKGYVSTWHKHWTENPKTEPGKHFPLQPGDEGFVPPQEGEDG